MTLADIQMLYEFNYWANARLMTVVKSLREEQFAEDLGSSHRSIHGTLVHIVGAEHIWLSRWTGQPVFKLIDPKDYPTITAVQQKWDEVEQGMSGFVSELTDERLSAVLTYKTTEEKQFSNVLWQMMQHLVNHSTYHRGQIVTMLRQLGVKPVGTDLITFYREKQS
ncbi:MAG: DinB family protein [Bacteroidota bacterium]